LSKQFLINHTHMLQRCPGCLLFSWSDTAGMWRLNPNLNEEYYAKRFNARHA